MAVFSTGVVGGGGGGGTVVTGGFVVGVVTGGKDAVDEMRTKSAGVGSWSWGSWTGSAAGPAPAGGRLALGGLAGSAWLSSTRSFGPRTLDVIVVE